MADKHPYTSGGAGGIEKTIAQLRSAFPAAVNVDTLKRFDIAKGNERNMVDILKFVGVLDAEGKKVPKAAHVFAQHEDSDFQAGFAELVKAGYADLFALHSDKAWTLDANKLIAFFRTADATSSLVGQRQTLTFQTLASICGKIEASAPRVSGASKARSQAAPKSAAKKTNSPATAVPSSAEQTPPPPAPAPAPATKRVPSIHIDVQVHISPDTSPEQIDRIFASMSKHLGGFVG